MEGSNIDDAPVALAARTETTRTCPRCGTMFELPDRGPGRRPVWCSGTCRRLASAERVAARNAGSAVTVVEVPRAHRPDPDARLPIPSMATLMRLFLSSQPHCRELLDTLISRYRRDQLGPELRTTMEVFAASITRQHALNNDPAYRAALAEVEQQRRHLQMEADRAEDRHRELLRMRAELTAKNTLITQMRAELTNPHTPLLETVGEPQHVIAGPRLSRQQRRAAARNTNKNR